MRTIILFLLLMIAPLSQTFSQTSKDTSICISAHQAKTINLIVNRLEYMEAKDTLTTSLLKLKEDKIAVLNNIISIREEALVYSNTKLTEAEKQIKRKNLELFIYKTALIGSAITIIFILL